MDPERNNKMQKLEQLYEGKAKKEMCIRDRYCVVVQLFTFRDEFHDHLIHDAEADLSVYQPENAVEYSVELRCV